MPTSILHSLTTFLSRRYNLNSSTPSNSNSRDDRESLARDVAYSLKHIPTTTTTQSQSQQQLNDGTTASVEDGNDDLETTLQELQQTLATCEVSLKEFESKERFLYMRIERYRELIRERECLIMNAAGMHEGEEQDEETKKGSGDDNTDASCQEGDDEEEVAASSVESETQDNDLKNINKHKNLTQEQLTQLQQKHQQDQTNLQAVETIHAEIIVQIETIKRRIVELVEKQQDIVKKREECQEFLVEFAERDVFENDHSTCNS